MQIHYMSDLHLEHRKAQIEMPSGEILVLAGDVRWEESWPLSKAEYVPLYLQENQTLSPDASQAADEVVFDGASGQTEFEFVFDQDTEVTGYAKLKVWIEARGASGSDTPPDDLVLCCFVDKRDRSGGSVRFNGAVGQAEDMVTRGYGRAARRALNTAESRPWHPVLSGDKHEPIKPGETVPLEIAFCPSSTFFTKGERLRLIISAKDIVHAPIFKKDTSVNRGRHVIHFGKDYDSHLLLPTIPTGNR